MSLLTIIVYFWKPFDDLEHEDLHKHSCWMWARGKFGSSVCATANWDLALECVFINWTQSWRTWSKEEARWLGATEVWMSFFNIGHNWLNTWLKVKKKSAFRKESVFSRSTWALGPLALSPTEINQEGFRALLNYLSKSIDLVPNLL